MTRISITDLKGQHVTSFLKDEKNNLISSAIDRALDARKVTGGIRDNCGARGCEKPQ
jgi:hypothetical protein